MNRLLPIIFCTTFLMTSMQTAQAADSANKSYKLKTEEQTMSYALGMALAKNLGDIPVDLDKEAIIEGIKAELGLTDKLLSDDELRSTMEAFQRKLQAEQTQQEQGLAEKNRQEGLAYFKENAKKKGVLSTPSGLQYEIVRQGDGAKPNATDTVEVHYRGTFIGGEEFDSSYKRNQTASFPLNRVIHGWTEILQLMPVGSKFKVAIPGKLAYGANGRPPIGPDRTLLFDIELISIK